MADTIEKISDTQIKITSTVTQSRVMSVDVIKRQIDSMTIQLAALQDQLDRATALGVVAVAEKAQVQAQVKVKS